MIPRSVRITHNRGSLKLHLPNFFAGAPIGDIRKVMRLIKKHPYENEATREILDKFFPEWESNLKESIKLAEAEQLDTQNRFAWSVPTSRKVKAKLKADLMTAADMVSHARTALKHCIKVIAEYKAIKA